MSLFKFLCLMKQFLSAGLRVEKYFVLVYAIEEETEKYFILGQDIKHFQFITIQQFKKSFPILFIGLTLKSMLILGKVKWREKYLSSQLKLRMKND